MFLCGIVYLFVGLILMLLLVANVYDVPELNFGHYFRARNDDDQGTSVDDEHKKLHPAATATAAGGDEQQHRYTETVNRSYQKDPTHFEDSRYLTEDG